MKCRICGYEFVPTIRQHYISRDNDQTGIAAAFSKAKKSIYDTFDCPECGCQIIAQERKRTFIDVCFAEEVNDDDDECESES